MFIVIPILIIAAIVGVYHRDEIFESLNLSIPQIGESGLNIRQFLGSPGGSTPEPDSPIRQLGD